MHVYKQVTNQLQPPYRAQKGGMSGKELREKDGIKWMRVLTLIPTVTSVYTDKLERAMTCIIH